MDLKPTGDKVFDGKNLIVVFANVIFFIIVQTLFFKYIASKQFNVVLADKVGIANELAKYDPFTSKQIYKYVKSDEAKELKNKALELSKTREKMNIERIKKWIGPPLIAAVCLLLLSVFKMAKQGPDKKWSGVDWVLLSFVLGAYGTEILFYLGIVRKFNFYGDLQIFDTISKKTSKTFYRLRSGL